MRRTETCAELSRSIERKFDEIVAFAETCPERSRRIERFLDTPVKRPLRVQRHAFGACAWRSRWPRTF